MPLLRQHMTFKNEVFTSQGKGPSGPIAIRLRSNSTFYLDSGTWSKIDPLSSFDPLNAVLALRIR